MCGHCGCHGVPAIRELRDEHDALLDEAEDVRRALADGDRVLALKLLDHLVGHLAGHVHREEEGIFTAMRDQGEFVAEVAALEDEHRHLDAALAGLDAGSDQLDARVAALFAELAQHIEREDLGLFPASVVTLGAGGWERVERAHTETPSFLPEWSRP